MAEPASEIASDTDLKRDLKACGNCGRRIQPTQKYVEIYNTRHKGYEHYHEDYRGCFESTRESGRRVILDRYRNKVNWDRYDLDGTISIGWTL